MEVSFPSTDSSCDIHGTLQLPPSSNDNKKKKVPAFIIVNGSGPLNRDGNVRATGLIGSVSNMNLNTSKLLSEYLSSSSLGGMMAAVLTYDKRGIGMSVGENDPNLYYRAGVHDFVSDAVQAFQYMVSSLENIDADNIFFLGHSEGAIFLPLIMKQLQLLNESHPKNVAVLPKGLIFLSGFGECVRDAAGYQRQTLLEEVKEQTGIKGLLLRHALTREKIEKQYDEMLKKINTSSDDDDNNPDFITMYCGLVKMPAKWMREHLALEDLRLELKEYTAHRHLLAIAGGNDRQVHSEYCDSTKVNELVPNAASVETHIMSNLTHTLRSMEKPCQLINVQSEYSRMGKLPLDPELLSVIGTWCQRIINE